MKLAIVSPAYNEQASLPIFFDRVQSICERLIDHRQIDAYEVFVVDDGSTDSTWQRVRDRHAEDWRFRGLRLSRNFGQHTATLAGLDHVRGDFLIVLDCDLQANPEDILKLLQAYQEGAKVVFGVARSRVDPRSVRWTSWFFYTIFERLTGKAIPRHLVMSGFTANSAGALRQMRECRRSPVGLYTYIGFDPVQVPLDKAPRAAGKAKWTFAKRLNLALTSIAGFSKAPLRLAPVLGLVITLASFVGIMFVVFRKLLWDIRVPGWPSLMAAVALFSGVQLLYLGIVGEYFGILLDEVKQRPLYLTDALLDGDDTVRTKTE